MSSVDTSAASLGGKLATVTIDRRRMMGAAALAVAGVAAAPAFGMVGEAGLSTFRGQYAIHGGHLLSGYFASPKGKTNLGVVVLMAEQGTSQARVDAAAQRHARAGYLAIAPDLAATYSGSAVMGRDAMVADLMAVLPNLKRLPLGNGQVAVVSV